MDEAEGGGTVYYNWETWHKNAYKVLSVAKAGGNTTCILPDVQWWYLTPPTIASPEAHHYLPDEQRFASANSWKD